MKKILLAMLLSLLVTGCTSGGVNKTEETENTGKVSYTDYESEYDKSDINYVGIKFLTKNAEQYKGKIVASVGEIYEVNDSDFKIDTDDSNFFIELTCNMKKTSDLDGLGTGEKVCFVGKVGGTNTYFGNDTTDINECFIIAKGSECSKYETKIEKNKEKQKKYVNSKKESQKKKKTEKKKSKKESYIAKCKTYPYNKIKRNPDSYEGKKIKVTGKVVQIEEGWFDSVDLRVENSNGNDWYISYSYPNGASKILEGDKISVYGECDGTEQYETIVGDTRRIPSIDAKYID